MIVAGSACSLRISVVITRNFSMPVAARPPTPASSNRNTAWSNDSPLADAQASSFPIDESPTPRLGVLMMRLTDTSSVGFTIARR